MQAAMTANFALHLHVNFNLKEIKLYFLLLHRQVLSQVFRLVDAFTQVLQ